MGAQANFCVSEEYLNIPMESYQTVLKKSLFKHESTTSAPKAII